MNSALSIFKGRRVFITGDTGFKGSWLALWLDLLGADIFGYALPPLNANDHYAAIGLSRRIHHMNGDICDLAKLCRAVQDFKPEFVFHLAAQPLVRQSYSEPQQTFQTNLLGSVNLLEAVRKTLSVRSLIYVTTDKCYLNKNWVWGYRENDELGGKDPYSASKAAAEMAFSAYTHSFFADRTSLGTASVRAGNVIGGGDWSKDRLVPDCVRAITKSASLELRNPKAVRPWQHVLDPIGAYLLLAARLFSKPKKYTGSWNFGPADDALRTVQDVAQAVTKIWGSGKTHHIVRTRQPYEASLLQLNCDKARRELDWQPRWGFDRAIRETVRWYKDTAAGHPAVKTSETQIRNYMENAHDTGNPNHAPQTNSGRTRQDHAYAPK